MISCLTLLALPVHPLPGPPCSPSFHVPDLDPARLLDRSSHLAMASYQGRFSTGFPTRRRVPRGSGGASDTQECLLVSLANREVPGVQGCSGSQLRSGQESGTLEQWTGSFPLPSSPQRVETPVTFQFLPPELRSLERCLFGVCFP